MGFFDELSSKLSSGAQNLQNTVKQQAKNISDKTRINGELNANNREIEKNLSKIGEIVKARLMNVIDDEEVQELAAEIDKLNARNAELEEELKIVTGHRTCVNCGTEIPADALFCQVCGARNDPPAPAPAQNETPQPQELITCPNCGNVEQQGAQFCSNCGARMGQ